MPLSIRALAGGLIRRWGLLPGGLADGIGDDDKLGDAVLTTRAVVFFPDPPENIYQLRQWYRALEALDEAVGVTVIVRDSRTAALVRDEASLPVIAAGRTRTVGRLLERGRVRLVLYVGQSNANAVALRCAHVTHVFLNHGDSDKFVSVSNQVKAFDKVFVAGPAAVDRHAQALMFYDPAAHVRIVGRPQLPPSAQPAGGLTVLYAPTWEGTMTINAYSSVQAYGERLLRALLADPEVSVIYRPHPRTGASDKSFKAADQRLRSVLAAHPDRASVDVSPDPTQSFHRAHIMVSDVSAIATDWLGQGRPLVSFEPADPGARVAAPARLFSNTPHLNAANIDDGVAVVRSAIADDESTKTLAELADYYLGGLSAEQATERFVAECESAAAECDAERARLGVEQ